MKSGKEAMLWQVQAHPGKGKSQTFFDTARVGNRGQIVLHKEIRELLGIKSGDTLLILGEEDTSLLFSRP